MGVNNVIRKERQPENIELQRGCDRKVQVIVICGSQISFTVKDRRSEPHSPQYNR